MRLLTTAILATATLAAPGLLSTSTSATAPPLHDVDVVSASATALTSYPAFDAGTDRYAMRADAGTDVVTVTASSSEADATVSVNGRPVANGAPTTVTGLEPGDEVAVQITDSAGTSRQSWLLLPPGFPRLTATGEAPGLADGLVFLTLSSWLGGNYSAVVDANGVPVRAVAENTSDFKRATLLGTDAYSAAVPDAADGYRIALLDDQFREVRSHRIAGDQAASTDFHDSTLFADGSALLMGYDFVSRDGGVWTDSLIERQAPDGTPTLHWNSKDHVDEEIEGLVPRSASDYAHVNSLQELANGDVVASFRNLSQVMLIAGSDHDGHDTGDVIWRLGGLRNDFDFVDDPYGGPCAQHAASILDNGHLLVFDNGARRDETGAIAPQTADMCPDGDDPTGPRVARPQSRITEYALDTTSTPPTATLVWSHEPTGRYAPFAGNAQRLPNGNTFAGWSESEVPAGQERPVATEVDPDGNEIWSLRADGYFSYRAFKDVAPDRTPPTVTIDSPADGAVVAQGEALTASFGCMDTGGANLATCAGTSENGADLSREPGTHTLTVTASDGHGNTTSRSVPYTVTPTPGATPTVPPPTPAPPTTTTPAPLAPTPIAWADAMIRPPGGPWSGRDTSSLKEQTVTLRPRAGTTTTVRVRIRNSGDAAGRMRVFATAGNRWVSGRWYAGKRDVTTRLRASAYRTSRLEPGESVVLRLVLTVRRGASGRTAVPRLSARARYSTSDVVRARVEVR